MQTMNTMTNVAHKRSVLAVAAVCATFLLFVLRNVDAWDIGRHSDCKSSISQWRNDIAYKRRLCHRCNLFRHVNPSKFSRPLRRRNSLQLGLSSFRNNNDIVLTTGYLAAEDTPQCPRTTNKAPPVHQFHRRHLLLSSILMLTSSSTLLFPKAVMARGLVHFPCVKYLANSYHFLRVGVTLLEEEGKKKYIIKDSPILKDEVNMTKSSAGPAKYRLLFSLYRNIEYESSFPYGKFKCCSREMKAFVTVI